MLLEKVILSQNAHWTNNEYESLEYRSEIDGLLKKNELPHIQVLTGIRRSGKSSIFKLIINHLMKTVSPKNILFLNMDDPVYSFVWSDSSQLYNIIETAEKLSETKIHYLFLDEIQSVKQWERFVKSAYDAQIYKKIYVTGSNSSLLKNDFSILLSGRYFANSIQPYSLMEVLKINGIETEIDKIEKKPTLLKVLDDCVEWGSFPEILQIKDATIRRELLKNYFDSIVFKDCISYHQIRDVMLFKQMILYILSNIGNLYSFNSLAKALNSNENTIKTYLEILQDSFIVEMVQNFSYSTKTNARSASKIYCADNGLITALSFRFSENRGRMFENFVFNELRKKGYDEIYFSNQDGECDFIVKKPDGFHAFQVCTEITPENKARELNGFKQIAKKIQLNSKHIVTFNQQYNEGDINIIPVWKLL
ncbi:MAG: ATP-binding protein [Paludibacter sp.]|nr:ATP-binding protein [Paludibacter sp.]